MISFSDRHQKTNKVYHYTDGGYDQCADKFSCEYINPTDRFIDSYDHIPYLSNLGFQNLARNTYKLQFILTNDGIEPFSRESNVFYSFGSGYGNYIGKR